MTASAASLSWAGTSPTLPEFQGIEHGVHCDGTRTSVTAMTSTPPGRGWKSSTSAHRRRRSAMRGS